MPPGLVAAGPPYADRALPPARLGADQPPVVVTVLSTEEEFDWSKPFDRSETSVRAAAHIGRAQDVFDQFGVRPCYVCDYPIVSQPESVAAFKSILDDGRCEIGAHLHPWVSPPHEEVVDGHNSFPGNLPAELEEAKIRTLAETIEANFGQRPKSYQAGRYGFGPNTAGILARQGFELDFSGSPPFDFRPETGPDFSDFSSDAFWFGADHALLGVPVSGAYVGFLRGSGPGLHRIAESMAWAKVPGILSRLGALDRLRLSPEGFDHADHRRLTEFLLSRGVRVFVFSFHSPTVVPGCTDYVRTDAELADFLDRCKRYYDYFLGELGGRSMTPVELRAHLLQHAPPPSS